MRTHGTLIKWNDDRGFGFIAPANGGAEVFVHISAYPRGSRPLLNELISFETSTSADGKIRAVQVMRPGQNNAPMHTSHHRSRANRSSQVITLMIVAAIGAVAYFSFQQFQTEKRVRENITANRAAAAMLAPPAKQAFTCDGRTTCGQMTSCEEAQYFLANCPNTKMDGNGDGEPCELQWCN